MQPQVVVNNPPSSQTMTNSTNGNDVPNANSAHRTMGESGRGDQQTTTTISAEAQQEMINQKYQNLPKKQHHNLLLNRRTNKTYFDSGDYQLAKSKQQQPMATVMFDGSVATTGIPATPATVELTRHPPERRQSKLIES